MLKYNCVDLVKRRFAPLIGRCALASLAQPVVPTMSSLNQTNPNGPWGVVTLVPNRFFSYATDATVSVSGNVEVSLSRRLRFPQLTR